VLAEATRSRGIIGAGNGLESHLAGEQSAGVVRKSTRSAVSIVTVLEEETTEGRGTRRRGWRSRGKGEGRGDGTAPTSNAATAATTNVPSFARPFVSHGWPFANKLGGADTNGKCCGLLWREPTCVSLIFGYIIFFSDTSHGVFFKSTMYDVSWYDRIAYNPNVVTASISSIIALSKTVTNNHRSI
jgi:hypothetical protein